jgi:hypothetical protein
VTAVTDSSPLVILTKLGCLDFLNRVFPRVYRGQVNSESSRWLRSGRNEHDSPSERARRESRAARRLQGAQAGESGGFSLLLFRISLYPSGLLLLTTVRTSRPGRSEWLRLMSQRGGSSRKGGAILVLEDKRGSPGWAATPDSSIRKYSDFRIDASHQPGRFTHTRFRLRSRPGREHRRMGIRG